MKQFQEDIQNIVGKIIDNDHYDHYNTRYGNIGLSRQNFHSK